MSSVQGADEAGDRIATLDVFKNAQNVKVDPDKPLQQARYVTLKVSLALMSISCVLNQQITEFCRIFYSKLFPQN